MSDELKLPEVGELSFPQWQNWLVRYNRVLAERDHRIEKDAAHIDEQIALEEMSVRPSWAPTLPLAAEASYGKSYGDAK